MDFEVILDWKYIPKGLMLPLNTLGSFYIDRKY